MSAEVPGNGVRRCVVISGVNFTEGGPLTVFRDFIEATCRVLSDDWEIVVFAHDTSVVSAPRARIIAIPYAKTSWLRRLRVEWYEFSRFAAELKPDLWISMHDMSPNVGRVPQVVYCHNPSPFLRVRLRDLIFEPSLLLFRLAYSILYRVNLGRNRAIVVQQAWLRDAFRKWVGVRIPIIVAHPIDPGAGSGIVPPTAPTRPPRSGPATFLYPALPRAFKNMELLCRAAQSLEKQASWRSTLILTTDGRENRYARWLARRFGHLSSVRFAGRQTREQMQRLYREADCLLFPSRLETWGLPISEARQHRLPMLVADLPYAVEAVGTYPWVDFIDVDDHRALAEKLMAFQIGTLEMAGASSVPPAAPFVADWTSLVMVLEQLANQAGALPSGR